VPLANPFAKYQQTAVRTADRGDLLIMTYEALVRWLGRAEEAVDAGKLIDAHQALVNAQDLVMNLSRSLDFEAGGEIADSLASLYDYLQRQLVQANVEKDKGAIAALRELVTPLLDAWRMAVPTARKEGHLLSV